jgi:PIN domain nuclease of toxin-antitoxin system
MVWEISMHYYKNKNLKLENSILKYPKQHSQKRKKTTLSIWKNQFELPL